MQRWRMCPVPPTHLPVPSVCSGVGLTSSAECRLCSWVFSSQASVMSKKTSAATRTPTLERSAARVIDLPESLPKQHRPHVDRLCSMKLIASRWACRFSASDTGGAPGYWPTVDREGSVEVAGWNGGRIRRPDDVPGHCSRRRKDLRHVAGGPTSFRMRDSGSSWAGSNAMAGPRPGPR